MIQNSSSLSTCVISLNDWQLVKVSGVDSEKFLQGQLTNDITQLSDSQYMTAAHCDPKGKMWSNLLLFKMNDAIYYLLRKSVAEKQLAELKKFAIFSKVTIEMETQLSILAIAGNQARQKLATVFAQLPTAENTAVNCHEANVLFIPQPTERFIVIALPEQLLQVQEKLLNNGVKKTESEQWLALDIEANYPIIELATTNEFLPQAVNLDKLNSISFNKGCYCGQEMVARAQFRGINKRALFYLTGQSEQLPNIGDALEIQLGDHWRSTGTVLAAVRYHDSKIAVQAVLHNDLTYNDHLRILADKESTLKVV